MRTLFNVAAAGAASLALVACGGGSDYTAPPPPEPLTAVPDGAIVSSSAFVSFLNGQSFSDETSEPLTLPAGDLATSETDEPLPV
ncbi:hypothetical protein [Roseateles sp.]|uniref:hypothetical protein n=1 Tax=Roseateles sp. TaxID=1971397 RepID=UPI003267817F